MALRSASSEAAWGGDGSQTEWPASASQWTELPASRQPIDSQQTTNMQPGPAPRGRPAMALQLLATWLGPISLLVRAIVLPVHDHQR